MPQGHVHGQRQSLPDFVLRQAHGFGGGHRGRQRALLPLVVKPALALPFVDFLVDHVHHIVANGQRRDELLTRQPQRFAQSESDRNELRRDMTRCAMRVVHAQKLAHGGIGESRAFDCAAPFVADDGGLAARLHLRGIVRR